MANEDYAKMDSMLDDGQDESIPKNSVGRKIKNKAASTGAKLATGATSFGSRILAGGLAVAQTASVTSVTTILSLILGIGVANINTDMDIVYRDDYDPTSPYECLDEYVDAYKGVFGTINTTPLAEQNSTVVSKLKEINEWSKAYVGQSIPDRLVCDETDCPYYGHEGCTDPDHAVRQVTDGTYSYYDSDAKIDLANVKRIQSFFEAYGLTDVQIAAICGVMTIESRIDFTSVEGYNLSGDRYNLDPSKQVTVTDDDGNTKTYGFKPWAEGIGSSPVTTPTAIGQMDGYTGDDQPINYTAYHAEYPTIEKLGIGTVGFTDGPGFYNNTYLRNYADMLNDEVTMIQRIIEGSRGWREELRQRAADLYHFAYGANGNDERGTANHYIEEVDPSKLLILNNPPDESTGWRWKEAYTAYVDADLALEQAIDEYNDLSTQYQQAADALRQTQWLYHTVNESAQGTAYDITFEEHSIDDVKKMTTAENEKEKYVTISVTEQLKACDKDGEFENYYSYENNPSGKKNETDVVYPKAEPIYAETPKGSLSSFSVSCRHPSGPSSPPVMPQQPTPPSVSPMMPPYIIQQIMDQYYQQMAEWAAQMQQYQQQMAAYQQAQAAAAAAAAEHARIQTLVNQANSLLQSMQQAYETVQQKHDEFFATVDEFNEAAREHAHSVVNFYNALQDYYTACEFDMESKLRDAAFVDTTIYYDTDFYTEPAYEYEFNTVIEGDDEPFKFRDVFKMLYSGDKNDDTMDLDGAEDEANNKGYRSTVQELKLYYELWQNYAKYATNLPGNGKYINWWTPEVQLLYFVGGSYNADIANGVINYDEQSVYFQAKWSRDGYLKVRKKYYDGTPKYSENYGLNGDIEANTDSEGKPVDTTGKYYYEWMSTWKGEDYTSRDITTATRSFFYDMVSGGFDDGTLRDRTEYAYAYYYMMQYNSPYQEAINYASVGGEASKIMDEMIAEGRWQTNTSNTLSDTAMPHNDKWKEYQTAEITRQWEIDTSTSMSTSILATLGSNQSRSRVNLLTDIWNSCRYINVVDNSTIGNAAMYLVDNPLIYDPGSKFYKMKYGENPNPAPEAISSQYKVVYDTINRRLEEKGKTTMGSADNMSDGFTFVKTCILWSGMDVEFENIDDIDELKEYLEEATSSIWQGDGCEEDYQKDYNDDKGNTGRGNSKIWEQRKLGPYYDSSGAVYYRYKWVLVPRVLSDETQSDTDLKWYDDMREDGAERGFGNTDEDLDEWDDHKIDEHDTNNTPSVAIAGRDGNPQYAEDGYYRKVNEDNQRTADWVRIDWECWDKTCTQCGGDGGHGDIGLLCPGDIMISDDKVCIWLGGDTVDAMFPLETNTAEAEKLVYAGGDNATKLKNMSDGTGFEWSVPNDGYTSHAESTEKVDYNKLPTTPESSSTGNGGIYVPEGKWTVYRLITPNYTSTYRDAGIKFPDNDDDWETWYKYRYKGMAPNADTKLYLEEIRKELGVDQSTDTSDEDYYRNRN